jgi:hypothetical protein
MFENLNYLVHLDLHEMNVSEYLLNFLASGVIFGANFVQMRQFEAYEKSAKSNVGKTTPRS